MSSSEIIPTSLPYPIASTEVVDVEILPPQNNFREKMTGILAMIALCGLMGFATIDQNARTAFIGLSVGLVAGYTGVEVIKSKR